MGAVPGLVGLGGGAAGTSFAGPQGAQLQNPTTPDQISGAYSGVQNSMAGQQSLLQALQAQQGIQNQSQVYGQLQGIASGAVNPAQAQFNQNTAANVNNQAALMAGQRGAASNVGLMARQAAQTGAGIQQQAVGQEAAQQAQNQIAAIGAAGNLATTQAGQQIGQTNANVAAQQAEQSNLLGALQGYNTAQVGMQSNINQANASLAGTQMQGQQAMLGGAMNGAAALLGAGGGEAVKMSNGGWSQVGSTQNVDSAPADMSRQPLQFAPGDQYNVSNQQTQSNSSGTSAKSMFGNFIKGATNKNGSGSQPDSSSTPQTGSAALNTGMSNLVSALGKKKQQPDGSTDKIGSTFSATEDYAQGGKVKDFRSGGKVNASSPKEKAVAKGNDYANDKIPAVLSEHEIVLPRSVTLSKDPVNSAAKFVASVISKRKAKR